MKKQFTLLSLIGTSILLLTSCHLREKSSAPISQSSNGDSSSSLSSSSSSSVAPKTYTVTWKNEDGLVLETDLNVLEGTLPSYDGQTPTKPNDAQYNYVFTGWSPAISEVNADITYTATYQEELRKYTIIWQDENGSVLETDNDVPYGTLPEFNENEPTKESTNEHTYTFDGWSPSVEEVKGDATYVATYKEEVRKYVITWVNEDGTTLKTEEVAYGETPNYDGETPTKDSTNQYSYTFNGWSPNVVAVTGDATYTATYQSQTRIYTIKWVDYDGTVLETDTLEYGQTPHYNGQTPERMSIRGVDYTFKGWTPTIVPVYCDQIYTAIYSYDAYFSFDLIDYELQPGYTKNDLRGAPWINANLVGEINKIKKPSLKDDFYTAVNYDDIKNRRLGPFEQDSVYVSNALQAIFDNSEPTTNGAFISALCNKIINGDVSSISDYLNNMDLDAYLGSKDVFVSSSAYLQLNYLEGSGYEVEFNDGYLEESLGLHTLWFYSMFDGYSALGSAADNIAKKLGNILDFSITNSELNSLRSLDRNLSTSAYNDYYYVGSDDVPFTVNTVPWTKLKSALLDLGLAANETVVIKQYYINTLNYLFNDYAVNNAAALKKDIMVRLAFDYRFLLGVDNYKTLNEYIVNAYVFSNENYLGQLGTNRLAKELTKLAVPAIFEQSYIELQGDEDVKNGVANLIEDVIAGYNELVSNIDWLSQTTKNNVLRKLNKMTYASCYSDVYKNYPKINDSNLNSTPLFSLYGRYSSTVVNQAVNKVNKDPTSWAWDSMPSYTVNAFYTGGYNSFVILNGIVPAFVSDCTEELYGMLGFVIGHEITHAFDSNGSLYDENGENNDLMTSSDRSTFDKKVRKLINFYDNINLFDTTYVDGDNVDGEAIADMGGIKVMLQLAKNIPDFDYDIFFRAAARTWCEQPYDDSYAQMVIQDSHPFNYLRTNITLAQFDEFVETYNIGPGDGMYIPESQRVKIW